MASLSAVNVIPSSKSWSRSTRLSLNSCLSHFQAENGIAILPWPKHDVAIDADARRTDMLLLLKTGKTYGLGWPHLMPKPCRRAKLSICYQFHRHRQVLSKSVSPQKPGAGSPKTPVML